MTTQILTQKRLKELLSYNSDTGNFTYAKRRPRIQVGAIAGHTHKGHGYVQIKLDDKLYLAHRLAWLYEYGAFPVAQLDHINRNRTDNRLANLRCATNAENCQNRQVQTNSTSGHAGVTWSKIWLKWHARISVNNKRIHLGWFKNKDDAIAARDNAKLTLHKFTAA
jgi:hypothetical protein